MPVKGGRGVNGKITYIKLDDFDATSDLMEITQTDRDILLILSEQLDWKNRWLEPPAPLDNDDDRDAYIASLKLRLMEVINFCERMIDCIEDDQDVINAINNVYNQYGTGVQIPQTRLEQGLGTNIIDCNPDQLWGAVSELIESMHRNNLDFQEAVETLSNIAERLASLIAAIPLVETLPLDDAINFGQQVITDDIYEAYVANDTDAYRFELKCDLFCLARDNGCVLSMAMLDDYFAERVGSVGLDDFVSIMNFLSSGAWVGTQVNDLFYRLQVAAMKFGNQYAAIVGLYSYDIYMQLGANNPDPDWEILCTECNNLCRLEYQYDNDPDDFVITSGTDDPDFWIKSNTFIDTDYAVYTCEQVVPGNVVRIRLYFSDNLPKNCQYVLNGVTYALNGTPIDAGGGVYALTGEVASLPGNFQGVLARQDIGVAVEFYLMGTTIVYEC